MIGTTVGSYQITSVLSAGGMGTVYGAKHNLIGRMAAVKILHPEYSTNREIVNRFFNEARATSSIAHPGIVEIFDFGYLEDGLAFLVMEFLDGEPLSYRIRRGRMEEARLAFLLRSACGALAAAHAKGIVHRDLKPDNIYIVRDPDNPYGERTKLLDFGIAKLTDVGMAGTATKTGAVMGTPTYMSPEQCRGTGEVDARADIYSMGCVLYEMVCGRPPFTQQGAGELIGAHLYAMPEPLRKFASVSPGLEALIMRCLAKDPVARPQTAAELGSELARLTGISSSPNIMGMGVGAVLPPVPISHHTTPTAFTPSGQLPQFRNQLPMPAPMPTPDPRLTPGPQGTPAPNLNPSQPYGHLPEHHQDQLYGQPVPAATPHQLAPASSFSQPRAGVTSTTLGGAASQLTPALAPRKSSVWILIGALGAMALGAGVFFVTQSSEPTASPTAPVAMPSAVDAATGAMPDSLDARPAQVPSDASHNAATDATAASVDATPAKMQDAQPAAAATDAAPASLPTGDRKSTPGKDASGTKDPRAGTQDPKPGKNPKAPNVPKVPTPRKDPKDVKDLKPGNGSGELIEMDID